MTMTHKEHMLAVFRGQLLDRIPWVPRLYGKTGQNDLVNRFDPVVRFRCAFFARTCHPVCHQCADL